MKNKEKNRQSKGITLIALVVTIVVLILVSVVSIQAVFSDSGIIKQAEKVRVKDAIARVEEAARIRTLQLYTEHANDLDSINEETIKTAVKTELINQGYELKDISTTTETVKGLLIKDSTGNNIDKISLMQGGRKTISVALDTQGNTTTRTYVKIEGNYYELIINKQTVIVSTEAYKEVPNAGNGYEIKLTPPASGIKMTVAGIEIKKETLVDSKSVIEVIAGNDVDTFTFNVKETKTQTNRNVNVEVSTNPEYATSLIIATKGGVAAEVEPGKTIELVATMQPDTATDTVKWEMAEEGKATVNEQGEVTVKENATEGGIIKVKATCVRADNTQTTVETQIFSIRLLRPMIIPIDENKDYVKSYIDLNNDGNPDAISIATWHPNKTEWKVKGTYKSPSGKELDVLIPESENSRVDTRIISTFALLNPYIKVLDRK